MVSNRTLLDLLGLYAEVALDRALKLFAGEGQQPIKDLEVPAWFGTSGEFGQYLRDEMITLKLLRMDAEPR
jgi:hypothetical protein